MKLLSLILVLVAITTSADVTADQIDLSFNHEGKQRAYHLYVPRSYDKNEQTPLLLVLHGRTSNGQRMAQLTSFNSRADRHGFLVVYPDGLQKKWNYLHGIPGSADPTDDSKFLLKLIDEIAHKYSVDKNRLYVTGISNGGFMAQRLACYAGNKFAAFASVAATGYATMPASCKGSWPIDMLYMHGTADKLVPWEGLGIQDESGLKQLVTMSMMKSVKYWVARNQCQAEVSSSDILPKGLSPGTSVKVFSANECKNKSEVVLYAIIGGGHNWPGVPDFIPTSVAGRVNQDIHASDVIWSFFGDKRLHQ